MRDWKDGSVSKCLLDKHEDLGLTPNTQCNARLVWVGVDAARLLGFDNQPVPSSTC